jgi:hypothetical protein
VSVSDLVSIVGHNGKCTYDLTRPGETAASRSPPAIVILVEDNCGDAANAAAAAGKQLASALK